MVNNFLGVPDFSSNFKRVRDFLRKITQKTNPDYYWLLFSIYRRKEDYFIGGCGLKVDLNDRTAEIFFMLLPQEWGKGFTVEAVNPLLDNIKTQLRINNFFVLVLPENIRAQKVLEKLSFKYQLTFQYDFSQQKRSVQKWMLKAR